MTAYISLSNSNREKKAPVLSVICEELTAAGIDPFVFVDQYKFFPDQEREMMKQASLDIDQCDLMVAEVSEKAIGVGVEAGYAKAKNKPIIYLREKSSEHSTTVSGISDYQILYEDCEDLKKQLRAVISIIVSR